VGAGPFDCALRMPATGVESLLCHRRARHGPGPHRAAHQSGDFGCSQFRCGNQRSGSRRTDEADAAKVTVWSVDPCRRPLRRVADNIARWFRGTRTVRRVRSEKISRLLQLGFATWPKPATGLRRAALSVPFCARDLQHARPFVYGLRADDVRLTRFATKLLHDNRCALRAQNSLCNVVILRASGWQSR
jgi:hypothetical protein